MTATEMRAVLLAWTDAEKSALFIDMAAASENAANYQHPAAAYAEAWRCALAAFEEAINDACPAPSTKRGRPADQRAKLLAYLAKHPSARSLTPTALARASGVGRSTVTSVLEELDAEK